MKQLLFFLLVFLLLHQTGTAQQDSLTHRKIVYAELLGSGDNYSLNFEYLFKAKHSVSAGLSWMPGTFPLGSNDRFFLYIPVNYHYLLGKKQHYADLSGGLLSTYTVYDELPNHLRIMPQMGLAYRYQALGKGIFLKAGVNMFMPYFLSVDRFEVFGYRGYHWRLWPGIAAGWKF